MHLSLLSQIINHISKIYCLRFTLIYMHHV